MVCPPRGLSHALYVLHIASCPVLPGLNLRSAAARNSAMRRGGLASWDVGNREKIEAY